MAKKSKANSPRIGQQTKSSAKGAHGGNVKYSQVTLGPGFKNMPGKGANAGKSAAKLPKAKNNISEAPRRPTIAFGKGFVAESKSVAANKLPAVRQNRLKKK